ncbi:MAG: hypothetical protein KY440_00330 [Actinobacteria bacterium]|nr:hypothetical protein [Actinomycetota bacterium]
MRPRPLLAVGAVVVALMLTGCTDDGGTEPDPSASGSPGAPPASADGSGPSAAGPGASASTFPVPAQAQPSPLPNLGTREAGGLTLTLNAVRRVSPEAVVVEGTLVAKSTTPLLNLAEPGFAVRQEGGERPSTYEFSAVSLSAAGDPKVYLPLRDDKGFCACTQGIQFLDGGKSMGVYTYVTAPEQAENVTVTVARFAPFTDVPVTQ